MSHKCHQPCGLRVSLEKTEVLLMSHKCHQPCGLRRQKTETGGNAWRKMEGVMGDRYISRKLKGRELSACMTPAYLYGLETMAMMEKQQEKLQVCENNWK